MPSSAATSPDDAAEATRLLAEEVERLRSFQWNNLTELAGSSEHRQVLTPSGLALDLETQIAWDGDHGTTLYVILGMWRVQIEGGANPTEVAHDEFALSLDAHGRLIGPVRRREAAEHTAAGREGRRLSIAVIFSIVWIGFGWASAADSHFSAGAKTFAWVNTGAWVFVLGLSVWRWRKALNS